MSLLKLLYYRSLTTQVTVVLSSAFIASGEDSVYWPGIACLYECVPSVFAGWVVVAEKLNILFFLSFFVTCHFFLASVNAVVKYSR